MPLVTGRVDEPPVLGSASSFEENRLARVPPVRVLVPRERVPLDLLLDDVGLIPAAPLVKYLRLRRRDPRKAGSQPVVAVDLVVRRLPGSKALQDWR